MSDVNDLNNAKYLKYRIKFFFAEFLGTGLLFSITRKWAADGIVFLLLAFIPAHIYHIQMNGCLPGLCFPPWVVWVRLLVLHPILIAWAWWYRK